MLVKTQAIVISSLRYQEKSLIVKCFTREAGLKSYFVRNAFTGKTAQKIAYFQPLTMLEIEAVHKNKGTLETFREIKLATPFQTINTDIVKSTIILFVSEVLHHCIREEEKNLEMFAFLETALHWLDTHDDVANFHLILLLENSKFLGFYPDLSSDERFFEMTEGIFTPDHALRCLSEPDTHLLKRLLRHKFGSDQKVFSANERQILLKILLDYYSVHLEGFRKPKSLDVLREVFG